MRLSILELSGIVIAITFIILVIYLVPLIQQARQTARSVHELSEMAKRQIRGVEQIVSKIGPITILATILGFIKTIFDNFRKEDK